MTSVRDHVLQFYANAGWDTSTGWPRITPEAEARFYTYTLPKLQGFRDRAKTKRERKRAA